MTPNKHKTRRSGVCEALASTISRLAIRELNYTPRQDTSQYFDNHYTLWTRGGSNPQPRIASLGLCTSELAHRIL